MNLLQNPLVAFKAAAGKSPAVISLLGLLIMNAAAAPADLKGIEDSLEKVAAKATAATVGLSQYCDKGMTWGSGVIIEERGLILTAAHVVARSETVEVAFADGKRARAKVLGQDFENDLALVLIDGGGGYPFVELGDTSALKSGAMVVATGHHGGYQPDRKPPVRMGHVGAVDSDGMLQTDCRITQGDSGGPLFDLNGKVIGVHHATGIADDGKNNSHAPAATVRRDWDRLLKGERWGKPAKGSAPDKEALAGMDFEKFKAKVMAEAIRTGGKFNATSELLCGWLLECGMAEEKVKGLSQQDLIDWLGKSVGDGCSVKTDPGDGLSKNDAPPATAENPKAGPPAEETAIREAAAQVLGGLVPSVVTLLAKDKPLALGTIVGSDGSILTKHSEIAEAGDALQVRLSDGRILPGTIGRVFAEHDLALVKIAASDLPAVKFPTAAVDHVPGELLFSPGVDLSKPLMAYGVVSVPARTLAANAQRILAASAPAGGFGPQAQVSKHPNGFPMAIQNDQPLVPNQCGGIVTDRQGNIVGVNIARAGRADSYVIPADIIAGLLKRRP